MTRTLLDIRLRDAGLATVLAAALPAFLPVEISSGGKSTALLLTDDPALMEEAGRGILLPPGKLRLGALLDRLARALRGPAAAALTIGPFTLPADDSMLLRDDGTSVRLTEKERDLLWRLAATPGTVDRGALLADIWGYAEGLETHTLETHIYRLRQKLEDDPAAPRWLLTDGTGYRLAP